jgi:PAS domain-containing protein
VFDRTGAFVQADDAACELVGVPAGSLTGRSWGEFVRSGTPRPERAALWNLLEAHGSLQSVFDVPLPGGGFRVIEYHSTPTEDPDRFTSRWRTIAEIRAEDGMRADEEVPAGDS